MLGALQPLDVRPGHLHDAVPLTLLRPVSDLERREGGHPAAGLPEDGVHRLVANALPVDQREQILARGHGLDIDHRVLLPDLRIVDVVRNVGVLPLFSVLLLFLGAIVDGRIVSNPLFGRAQPHAEGSTDLVCVAVLSWRGECEVDRQLAVVHFASCAAPLTAYTDAVVSLFGNSHPVKDEC